MNCKSMSEEREETTGGAHSKTSFLYLLIVLVVHVVLLQNDTAIAHNRLLSVPIYLVTTEH